MLVLYGVNNTQFVDYFKNKCVKTSFSRISAYHVPQTQWNFNYFLEIINLNLQVWSGALSGVIYW